MDERRIAELRELLPSCGVCNVLPECLDEIERLRSLIGKHVNTRLFGDNILLRAKLTRAEEYFRKIIMRDDSETEMQIYAEEALAYLNAEKDE